MAKLAPLIVCPPAFGMKFAKLQLAPRCCFTRGAGWRDPSWNVNFSAGLLQGVSLALLRRRFFSTEPIVFSLKRQRIGNFQGRDIVFSLFRPHSYLYVHLKSTRIKAP
jgi:hypothetical protein